MPKTSKPARSLFVLLPGVNVWNQGAPGASVAFIKKASHALKSSANPVLLAKAGVKKKGVPGVTVLDEVAPQESLLVSLSQQELLELMKTQPGVRVTPVVEVAPLWLRPFSLTTLAEAGIVGKKSVFKVRVEYAGSGAAAVGVTVAATINMQAQIGEYAETDANGVASIALPDSISKIELLEVFAPDGYWPVYKKNVKTNVKQAVLKCPAIDLSAEGILDHHLLRGAPSDGTGVRVGVVDTGANAHSDLAIALGRNMVTGEDAGKYGDGIGHGTHVCGIIAGRGKLQQGMRGVAPGVDLHVYKVFGKGRETAESFHIAKAIRQAVDDGCDLINLSLGAEADMPEVLREIQRARALGCVCLAATGNDYRAPVCYPARYSQVMAVSAAGRVGTYPKGASQELCAVAPFGKDKLDYIADFSNIGHEVSLLGPGVGVVSTYKKGYAVMEGTSMACPAMTGALARLLSRHIKILAMERTQARSDAIVKLALENAQSLGFQPAFEGAGILV